MILLKEENNKFDFTTLFFPFSFSERNFFVFNPFFIVVYDECMKFKQNDFVFIYLCFLKKLFKFQNGVLFEFEMCQIQTKSIAKLLTAIKIQE